MKWQESARPTLFRQKKTIKLIGKLIGDVVFSKNTTSQIEKTLSLFEILLPDSLRKSHFFLYFPQGFVGKIAGFFCVGLDDPIQISLIFLKPRHFVLQRLQH